MIQHEIELVEVGPRDGLQNEAVILSTADKVTLIRNSVAAGIRRIEVASFVHPMRVPQMADAGLKIGRDHLYTAFERPDGRC